MIVYVVAQAPRASLEFLSPAPLGPFGIYSDRERALTKARELSGYVISWVVDGDFVESFFPEGAR